MNCQYCQNPQDPHPLDAKYPNPFYLQWICKKCDTYLRIANDKIMRIHWDNIRIGKRVFKARLLYEMGEEEWFTVYLRDGKGKHVTWDTFISWDFIPKTWSPQNISSKLKNLFPYL